MTFVIIGCILLGLIWYREISGSTGQRAARMRRMQRSVTKQRLKLEPINPPTATLPDEPDPQTSARYWQHGGYINDGEGHLIPVYQERLTTARSATPTRRRRTSD